MRKQRILEIIQKLAPSDAPRGLTAEEVANEAGILRHNASADLNDLCREGLVRKSSGRPVQFWAVDSNVTSSKPSAREFSMERGLTAGIQTSFDDMIGAHGSLRTAVEQAKAAMLYPPRGLPTLIVGRTGSGKSHLAEIMYHYAVQSGRLHPSAPFHVFNCADYAANPQLLLAQLFGYVKGAFTGADQTTPGLIAQTENGVLFLDEIHRLPPDGQEMLFLLMDRGVYRMLGDGAAKRTASVSLIAATSEDPRSVLLDTLLRRFPVVIALPELHARPLEERLKLTELFLREEATRLGVQISVSPLVLVALLTFRTVGNVGELRSAVLLGCAKAFLHHMAAGNQSGVMPLYLTHLAPQIQLDYLKNHPETAWAEQLVGVNDRLYVPERNYAAKAATDDEATQNLYSELHRRMCGYLESSLELHEVQKLIQIDVDYYSRRLLGKAGSASLLSTKFLQVVGEFIEEAGAELGYAFGPEVVTGLALHLASAPRSENSDIDRTLALAAHCSREYGVVRRLAERLEKSWIFALQRGR